MPISASMKPSSASFTTLCILALAVLFTASASATTYNWSGTVTNDLWNDASHWTGGGAGTEIPGSLLNGSGGTVLDDDVIITNQLASGNQNIRLQSDAGTIGTLTIGGAATGGANSNFQLRTGSAKLDVTGDVTLGGFDAGTGLIEKAGQLVFNNGNATMTIGGDIVSANGQSANRVVIDGGNSSNLTLTGTIDPGGAKEIDLWINRSGGFTTTAGVTLNVDNFRVGYASNANRTGRSYTLDGGRTINGNTMSIGFIDGNNAGDNSVSGTFDINGATATFSGTANIGQSNSDTTDGERNADGTVNVGAGGVLNTGTLNLGNQNDATVNVNSSSIGRLNLTDATSDVNVGNVNVGANLRGEGIITVDGGTLDTTGRLYIGGDETAGEDAGTKGTVTVNTGGTLTVGSGNTEVGRGGEGFLTVNGGTYNQVVGNLVVGQSFGGAATTQVATGTVEFSNGADVNIGSANNDINFNKGGGTITQSGAGTTVDVGRNINLADEGTTTGGSFSSTYTLNDGTLNVGTGNVEGDVAVANGAGAIAAFNVNGGTLNIQDTLQVANNNSAVSGTFTMTGGDVNVGIGGTNRDMIFAAGSNGTTGTANVSGGTLTVDNDVNFRGGNGVDTFTVSGNAIVDIGNNLDMDGGSGANVNRLTLEGSSATFAVGGNVLLDNNALITFDLDSSGATLLDAVGDLTLNSADLVVDFSSSGLTSAFDLGDIDLISFDGILTGAFSTFAFGDTVQAFGDSIYSLEQGLSGNGIDGVFLMAQVPEPSSILVLALSGFVFLRRRRK